MKLKAKKLIAVGLTLISPGCGHFYLGMSKLGIGLAVLNLTFFAFFIFINNFFLALTAGLLSATILLALIVHLLIKAFQENAVIYAKTRYVLLFLALTWWPTFIVGEYSDIETFSVPSSPSSANPGLPEGAMVAGYTYQDAAPEYGDLAVYKSPKNKENNMHRVVGLPGDKVRMKDGTLFLNGKSLQAECPPGKTESDTANVSCETLPNGKTIKLLNMLPLGPRDDTPAYEVPEDHYFVMGDNRDKSYDSRFIQDIGYIPRSSITHKIVLVYYPEIRLIE